MFGHFGRGCELCLLGAATGEQRQSAAPLWNRTPTARLGGVVLVRYVVLFKLREERSCIHLLALTVSLGNLWEEEVHAITNSMNCNILLWSWKQLAETRSPAGKGEGVFLRIGCSQSRAELYPLICVKNLPPGEITRCYLFAIHLHRRAIMLSQKSFPWRTSACLLTTQSALAWNNSGR